MLIWLKARSASAGFSLQVLQRHCADIVTKGVQRSALVLMRAIAVPSSGPQQPRASDDARVICQGT